MAKQRKPFRGQIGYKGKRSAGDESETGHRTRELENAKEMLVQAAREYWWKNTLSNFGFVIFMLLLAWSLLDLYVLIDSARGSNDLLAFNMLADRPETNGRLNLVVDSDFNAGVAVFGWPDRETFGKALPEFYEDGWRQAGIISDVFTRDIKCTNDGNKVLLKVPRLPILPPDSDRKYAVYVERGGVVSTVPIGSKSPVIIGERSLDEFVMSSVSDEVELYRYTGVSMLSEWCSNNWKLLSALGIVFGYIVRPVGEAVGSWFTSWVRMLLKVRKGKVGF